MTTLSCDLVDPALTPSDSIDRASCDTARGERDWLMWPLVIACVIAAVVTRVGFFAHPFYNDSGLYAYMGKVVAEGGQLYRDFYENKPPGAAMITSLCWRAFGSWWPGYTLTELALTFIAAAALARAAARHAGEHGRLAAFCGALVFLNFGWAAYTGFQLETIQACFAALAAAAALEALAGVSRAEVEDRQWIADAFAAGLAAGCAAMIKPTGLAVGGAFGLALLWAIRSNGIRRSVIAVASFAFGVAIPTAAVVFWVWWTGIMSEMPHLFRQIALYGSESPMDWFTPIKIAAVLALCAFPLLVRGWVFRRERVPAEDRVGPTSTVWVFAIGWAALELAGIVMQGRMYMYHFLPLAPPVALLFGLLPRPGRSAAIGLSVLPIALMSMRWRGSDLSYVERGTQRCELSDYLLAHTQPGDSVFQDQMGRVLMETGLKPGCRFAILYYWVNYDTAPQDYLKGMLDDFEQRRPRYIVLSADADESMANMSTGPILGLCSTRRANARLAWRDFRSYLAEHYEWEARVSDDDVFRRREMPAIAPPSAVATVPNQ
jgi:hypothetical protein